MMMRLAPRRRRFHFKRRRCWIISEIRPQRHLSLGVPPTGSCPLEDKAADSSPSGASPRREGTRKRLLGGPAVISTSVILILLSISAGLPLEGRESSRPEPEASRAQLAVSAAEALLPRRPPETDPGRGARLRPDQEGVSKSSAQMINEESDRVARKSGERPARQASSAPAARSPRQLASGAEEAQPTLGGARELEGPEGAHGTEMSPSASAPPAAAGSTSAAQAANKTLLQSLEQRRRFLELREKYMTNRAISDRAYYTLLVIYSLFILFGTISNSLICLTVILKPKILSPRNIFIVNLAGSDLLLCVFTMPFSFIEISMVVWQMGLLPCKLVAGLQATSIFVSTISITAIALDRYRVIVYPTHQESTNNTRSAIILLSLVWFVALLLSLPLFSFRTVQWRPLPMGPSGVKSVGFCLEDWPFSHGRGIYSVISMIFQYVLPITIVSVVYAKISDKLQKRLIRRQRLTQLECQQKKQLNLIKRTHTMLVSVSLIFGLSWLPLHIFNLIGDFSDPFQGDVQLSRIVFAVCHLIGCSSACTNPVLYGYLNENFRKEFRQVYAHHAHRLYRFGRRFLYTRLLCWCGRKLEADDYMASSSSSCTSASCTSGSSVADSDSRASDCRAELALAGDLEAGSSKSLGPPPAAADAHQQLARSGSCQPAEQDKSAPRAHFHRKASFQTLASSRQKLDRTMRFCLCLSTISSSSADSVANSRQPSLRRSTWRGEGKRRKRKKRRHSKAKLELRSLRRPLADHEEAQRSLPNGSSVCSSRRVRRKRPKTCLCKCHLTGEPELAKSSAADAPSEQKLVDGAESSNGRRVWLRFFPANERFCKVSGASQSQPGDAQRLGTGSLDMGDSCGGGKHCAKCQGNWEKSRRKRKESAKSRSLVKSAGSPKSSARRSKSNSNSPAAFGSGSGLSTGPKFSPCSLHARNSAGATCGSRLTQGIRLANSDEEEEEEEEEAPAGQEDALASLESHLGHSGSRREKSRLTGRYFLSVETVRRKLSSENTSSSKERTSSSLVLMNCTELESEDKFAGSQVQAKADAQRQETPEGLAAGDGSEINLPKLAGRGSQSSYIAGISSKVSISEPIIDHGERAPASGEPDSIRKVAPEVGQASKETGDALEPASSCRGRSPFSKLGGEPCRPREYNRQYQPTESQGCQPDLEGANSRGPRGGSGRPETEQSPKKEPSNNNDNSNSSSFACLATHSSSCSCSLTHSSATSSLSSQLNDDLLIAQANRKQSLLKSTTVSTSLAGDIDNSLLQLSSSISVANSSTRVRTRVGQAANACSKSQRKPLAPNTSATTTATTTTCSLASGRTHSSSSRRSSLNSEFVCSTSNGSPSASSSRKSIASLEESRECSSMQANRTNTPNGEHQQLSATTSEQISVNNSAGEPRNSLARLQQNGFPGSQTAHGGGQADAHAQQQTPTQAQHQIKFLSPKNSYNNNNKHDAPEIAGSNEM